MTLVDAPHEMSDTSSAAWCRISWRIGRPDRAALEARCQTPLERGVRHLVIDRHLVIRAVDGMPRPGRFFPKVPDTSGTRREKPRHRLLGRSGLSSRTRCQTPRHCLAIKRLVVDLVIRAPGRRGQRSPDPSAGASEPGSEMPGTSSLSPLRGPRQRADFGRAVGCGEGSASCESEAQEWPRGARVLLGGRAFSQNVRSVWLPYVEPGTCGMGC
jgi:hypothetical protein